MKPLRVFHVPEAVAGNSPGLAAAETRDGLESRAVTLRPHPFAYDGVESLCRESSPGPFRILWAMVRMFLLILREADVLHLNFGRSVFDPGPNVLSRIPSWTGIRFFLSLLQKVEMRAYRLRNIPVFMTYQGDDSRQGDVSLKKYPFSMANHVGEGYYTAASDALKRKRIDFFAARTMGTQFLNPDLGALLPEDATFLPYTSVNPAEWEYAVPAPGEVRHLVHAPSHRGAKGSTFILDAMERLKTEGVDFRFTVVEGKTREEACAIYRDADLVVDQLLAGWYGGLAVECMAMGKPVIAYIREEDLNFIPQKMKAEIPLIQADPESIYEVLKDWLNRPVDDYVSAGEKSRSFVETWHDPDKIARDLKEKYEKAVERIH